MIEKKTTKVKATAKAVAFTGHREISHIHQEQVRERLKEAVLQAIRQGASKFYCGMALGFDMMAAEEVLSLKLDADWVVLSACNTAAGEGAGAEAVSGLGRAFFYAGARALLVSNWPVETVAARLLMTEMFRLQGAEPALLKAEALRRSMLSLMDGPGARDGAGRRTLYTYAHPLFWAPFVIVGD